MRKFYRYNDGETTKNLKNLYYVTLNEEEDDDFMLPDESKKKDVI